MKKIVCLSDTHGSLPEVPDGDFLIISGDISLHSNSIDIELEWINDYFIKWLSSQPHKHKIFVAGNHDFCFELKKDIIIPKDVIYLENENCLIDGIKIFGSPFSVKFGNWAFMKEEDQLRWYWDLIPDDVNIIISHGPPYSILDYANCSNCGSKSLLDRINNLNDLKLCVFGHIHEGYGIKTIENKTFINASFWNERFSKNNKIQVFEYKE